MQPVCESRTTKTGHSGAKEETRPVKRREDKEEDKEKTHAKPPRRKMARGRLTVTGRREKEKKRRKSLDLGKGKKNE